MSEALIPVNRTAALARIGDEAVPNDALAIPTDVRTEIVLATAEGRLALPALLTIQDLADQEMERRVAPIERAADNASAERSSNPQLVVEDRYKTPKGVVPGSEEDGECRFRDRNVTIKMTARAEHLLEEENRLLEEAKATRTQIRRTTYKGLTLQEIKAQWDLIPNELYAARDAREKASQVWSDVLKNPAYTAFQTAKYEAERATTEAERAAKNLEDGPSRRARAVVKLEKLEAELERAKAIFLDKTLDARPELGKGEAGVRIVQLMQKQIPAAKAEVAEAERVAAFWAEAASRLAVVAAAKRAEAERLTGDRILWAEKEQAYHAAQQHKWDLERVVEDLDAALEERTKFEAEERRKRFPVPPRRCWICGVHYDPDSVKWTVTVKMAFGGTKEVPNEYPPQICQKCKDEGFTRDVLKQVEHGRPCRWCGRFFDQVEKGPRVYYCTPVCALAAPIDLEDDEWATWFQTKWPAVEYFGPFPRTLGGCSEIN